MLFDFLGFLGFAETIRNQKSGVRGGCVATRGSENQATIPEWNKTPATSITIHHEHRLRSPSRTTFATTKNSPTDHGFANPRVLNPRPTNTPRANIALPLRTPLHRNQHSPSPPPITTPKLHIFALPPTTNTHSHPRQKSLIPLPLQSRTIIIYFDNRPSKRRMAPRSTVHLEEPRGSYRHGFGSSE